MNQDCMNVKCFVKLKYYINASYYLTVGFAQNVSLSQIYKKYFLKVWENKNDSGQSY